MDEEQLQTNREEREKLQEQLEILEAKVQQAVEALRTLKQERDQARAALRERGDTVRELETRMLELQSEREEVRQRVEKLVAQIDARQGDSAGEPTP